MPVILALDIATTTGFALQRQNNQIESGRFVMRRGERQGQRCHQFKKFLTDLKNRLGAIDYVVWEHAFRQPGVANEVHHNLVGVLLTWAEHHSIGYHKVGASEIKKFATGSGKADKAAMIKAAKDAGYEVIDDNEADALHLLRLAIQRIQTEGAK